MNSWSSSTRWRTVLMVRFLSEMVRDTLAPRRARKVRIEMRRNVVRAKKVGLLGFLLLAAAAPVDRVEREAAGAGEREAHEDGQERQGVLHAVVLEAVRLVMDHGHRDEHGEREREGREAGEQADGDEQP